MFFKNVISKNLFLICRVLNMNFTVHFWYLFTKNYFCKIYFRLNLFLENKKFKIVEKLKTERIKAQLNNKNVIYPLGKKEKVVIQLYHEEIHFFCVIRIVQSLLKMPSNEKNISSILFYIDEWLRGDYVIRFFKVIFSYDSMDEMIE